MFLEIIVGDLDDELDFMPAPPSPTLGYSPPSTGYQTTVPGIPPNQ